MPGSITELLGTINRRLGELLQVQAGIVERLDALEKEAKERRLREAKAEGIQEATAAANSKHRAFAWWLLKALGWLLLAAAGSSFPILAPAAKKALGVE